VATEVQPEIAALPASAAPVRPAPRAAGADQPAKSKGEKKSAKGETGEQPQEQGPSVAAHPRAARAVARAKGWGGLGGFLLGGYLALPTSTLAGAGLRALEAGVVGYVAVWAGAVFVWRRLVILELKGREQTLLAEAQSQLPAGSPPEQGRTRIS
jgi:hypothetical protein